jgi:hypothetical protein
LVLLPPPGFDPAPYADSDVLLRALVLRANFELNIRFLAGYFRDPSHVARVQAWRALHPGYGRGRHRTARALQDPLIV